MSKEQDEAYLDNMTPAPASDNEDWASLVQPDDWALPPDSYEKWKSEQQPAPATAEWTAATPSGIWQGDKFLAYARNKTDAEKIVDAHKAAIAAAYEKGKEDGYAQAYDRYSNR